MQRGFYSPNPNKPEPNFAAKSRSLFLDAFVPRVVIEFLFFLHRFNFNETKDHAITLH